MDRFCRVCGNKLEPDEKELCTHCDFHEIIDEFESGKLG